MKKTSKTVLALLLSLLLMLGTVSGAFAAYSEGADGPADYSAYLNTDSIRSATPDQIATMTFDYLDDLLGRYGQEIMDEIKEDVPNFPFDMTSIDNVVASSVALLKAGTIGGEFARLDVSAIEGKSRADGDLKLAYAILQFVSDNAATAAKLLTGNFDFGNFFPFFGADEETEQEIVGWFHNFSVYSLVKEAMGLEDDDTIDNWINTKINELLSQVSIGGSYSYDGESGEETYEAGTPLDVTVDISNQSLYEIIDELLEGLVKMVTIHLTHTTFGPDATFGDYLADLADYYIGVGLEELGIDGDSPIAIQRDSLYDALKKFVDALITGYEDDINMYLNVVNVFVKLLATPGGFMALVTGSNESEAFEVAPDSELYQTLYALGYDDIDEMFGVSLVDYGEKTYLLSRDRNYEWDSQTQTDVLVSEKVRIICATDLNQAMTLALESGADLGDSYDAAVVGVAMTQIGSVFNPNCNLTVDDFDLVGNHDTYFGFVGELNHILAVALDEALTPATGAIIDWTDGTNDLFSGNIWKLVEFAATSEKMAGLVTMLKTLTSEEQVAPYVAVVENSDSLKAAIPGILNLLLSMIETTEYQSVYDDQGNFIGYETINEGSVAEKIGYVNADSIEEIVAFFLNLLGKAVSEEIDFTDAIISNGAYVVADTMDYWKNTSFNILVHIVMWLLADLDEASNGLVGCGFTYAEYKALGWTWQEGLDEIADWAISFADGAIPALDDVSHERGVYDGQGAWYKVSKVLDSLLPLGIINGCAKTYGEESFAFDLGALIEDVLFDGIINMDLGKILNLLTVNTDEANVFYGNSLYDAVIRSVQKLVNGILPGALPDELLGSMLTAITAENLIQFVRNIAASIGNRGAQLEKFAIRIFTLAMSGGATTTEGHYDSSTGNYVVEEHTDENMLKLSKVRNIEQIFAFLINDLGAKQASFPVYDYVDHQYVDEYSGYTYTYTEYEVVEENPFPFDYDALIYDENGNFLEEDHAYWKNLSLDMCADLLVWVMNKGLPEIMGFDMDDDKVAAYKEAGWGWEAFLDEVVDWAFSYLQGVIPALDNVSAVRGVLDGNGPWYKISLLLNALLPMSILDDCEKTYGDETFPFDIGVLVDKAYEGATELQIAGLTDVLRENDDGSNPFFDRPLVQAVLVVVQNLLNGILPGTIEDGMLISIDDTLRDSKLAKIAVNMIRSVNNRKQYLIPTAVDIMTRLTVFDFLVPWLQCGCDHHYKPEKKYGGCVEPARYIDVCEDCGFTFDVYYTGEEARGYHTDLDRDAICDICGNYITYQSFNEQSGEYYYFGCYHGVETYVGETIPATCGEAGVEGNIFCARCNALIQEGVVLPPTDEHVWDDGEITTSATCKDTGIRTFHCANCTATKEEPVPVDETAHVWDDGEITTPATCKTTGVKTFTCEVCEDTYTETIPVNPSNHDAYGTRVVNAKNATCSENGYTGDTVCSGCGATLASGSVINATGSHADADNDGHCDTCGAQMTGSDYCPYCGKIHDGFFGWLVRFFHKIFALFKR